jgi:hypothetical protein
MLLYVSYTLSKRSLPRTQSIFLLVMPRHFRQRNTHQHNSLYSWHSLYSGMIFRASFGIFSSIGALLLFAIWPNILPLQQYFAMAQIIPGAARVPTFGSAPANTTATGGAPANTTATGGAPANTTATGGAPANTTATGGAPDPGDPAGEEVVPHWYGGTPCHDEIESNCAK